MALYSEFIKVILCRNGTEERMQFEKKSRRHAKTQFKLKKKSNRKPAKLILNNLIF